MFSTIAACALAATLVQPTSITSATPPSESAGRPELLLSLYASFATLQALDVHSTTLAINSGAAREANPALKGIAGSPAALLAVKAATTGATIWLTEKLRKEHPRLAIVFMAALNSAMAAVVAHNYSVR